MERLAKIKTSREGGIFFFFLFFFGGGGVSIGLHINPYHHLKYTNTYRHCISLEIIFPTMCGMPIFDKLWYAWVSIFQKLSGKKKKICPSGDEKETQSGGPPETIFFFSLASIHDS